MKYLAITEYATEELIKIFAKETVNLLEEDFLKIRQIEVFYCYLV